MMSFRKALLGLASKMLMDKPHGIVNVVSKGVGTYGEPKVISCDLIRIAIGNYWSIATGVTIIAGGNHNMYTPTTYPFPERDKDIMNKYGPSGEVKGNVIVGNDVWIGVGATLMEGITVGDGAIIGAMAVVASNVPPYAIVVGNPAKILRYRFAPERINEMLKLKWWDWQPEKIRENMGWLLGKTADLKGSQ